MKHFRTRNSIILLFGIALLVIVAIASTSCVKNNAQLSVDNIYPHAAVVVEVDDVGDCVYASDYNGEVWMFYGAEDWMIGDIAAMIIDDCGTPEVAGDKIVSVRCCGSIAVG